MSIGKDLFLYNMDDIRNWCNRKGLKPGRIIGTSSGIMLTNGKNKRFEVISFNEFEGILKEKNLGVYGTKEGWMRIMRKN